MNIINLTPHAIRILGADGTELANIPPDGTVARVSVNREEVGGLSAPGGYSIPLYRVTYGKVTGLPNAIPGRAIVVSALVRLACPDRFDLFSPGELVRDGNGQPVGCRGLEGN